jgi:putative N6-adenine-specific DNA methylase
MDSYFAVVSPGLEPFTARELAELGLLSLTGSNDLRSVDLRSNDLSRYYELGGITFKGTRADLYRANLHLHTANRILARLGNFFYATTFPELEKRASRLPWERFISPGQPVSLRVTCHKSKLYHTDAVARTVGAGIAIRLGKPSPLLPLNEDSDPPTQLIIVRLVEDRCTISADSSGTLLHKRGYRQAVAKAPLRETLAAGMVFASGWDRRSPLIDPFCGSGTIPIEATMLAAGIPPGLRRRFAFMDWPDYEAAVWQTILTGSESERQTTVPLRPVIQASDRDAGAIQMAQANAERAGVADWIEFKQMAVSSITPPRGPGWVVTNPPYGERVSQGKDLRDLYARFGDVLREKCPGWDVSVLGSDPILLGQMRMELDTSLRLNNGGIAVRLARCKV